MTEQFEVLEVDIATRKVRMMTDGPTTEKNADAIERMAIMRRGTDDNFFVTVPAGKYADGDTYEG